MAFPKYAQRPFEANKTNKTNTLKFLFKGTYMDIPANNHLQRGMLNKNHDIGPFERDIVTRLLAILPLCLPQTTSDQKSIKERKGKGLLAFAKT